KQHEFRLKIFSLDRSGEAKLRLPRSLLPPYFPQGVHRTYRWSGFLRPAKEADDAGEIRRRPAGVAIKVIERGRLGSERRGCAARLSCVLGKLKVLQHHRGSKPG